MSNSVRMTERVTELLDALTTKVRAMSQGQVAEFQFGGDKANARRRLKQLAGEQLVERITVRARPLPELQSPVVVWKPGEELPDLGQAAYFLKGRWTGRVVRTMTAYVATEKAAAMIGGTGGQLRKPLQAGHDLGVTQVWIQFAATLPAWAEAWRGEDVMAHTRKGQKLPDGFLVNSANEVVWAIEFGGAYDRARLADFHHDCAERSIGYQIW